MPLHGGGAAPPLHREDAVPLPEDGEDQVFPFPCRPAPASQGANAALTAASGE
jgi:hypothetical protein